MNKNGWSLVHPFLFSVYFPLWLYARNAAQTEPGQFFWSAAVNLTVTGIGYALLAKWLRDRSKAAIAASAAVTTFFMYGHLHTALQAVTIDPWIVLIKPVLRPRFIHYGLIATHALLMLTTGLALNSLVRWLRKPGPRPAAPGRALTLAAAYLVVSAAVLLVRQGPALPSSTDPAPDAGKNAVPAQKASTRTPDIYYIILDGFAREDVLREYYRCDISQTTSRLRELGFFIPSQSRSNYSQTILSLSSSLNMTLHEGVEETPRAGRTAVSGDANMDRRYFDMIRKNRLMGFLKERGYRVVNFASIWSATMNMPQADIQFRYRRGFFQSEYGKALYGMSLLRVFYLFFTQDIAEWHLYNFRMLAATAAPLSAKPTFVFAHFVLPHSPYVFDRDGRILRHINRTNIWDTENNQYQDAAAYRDQAVYTGHEIVRTVQKILAAKRDHPPIIVLQADHGMNLIVEKPERVGRALRHANFCAIYFPDRDYSKLYDSITPVNIFRAVLDQYFGQGMGALPDKTVYTGT